MLMGKIRSNAYSCPGIKECLDFITWHQFIQVGNYYISSFMC